MKNTLICLSLLSVLITSTYCNSVVTGQDVLTIQGNDSPQSCLLKLTYSVSPAEITFSETVSNPNQNCNYHNLTFASQFLNSQVSGAIGLVQESTNASLYKGKFTMADLKKYNGTACVMVVPSGYDGHNFHVCKFKYGSIYFHFFALTDTTSSVFSEATGLIVPLFGATVSVQQNGETVWKPSNNQSYTGLVGQLYSQCGGWSKMIPSGNNQVYLTGTVLSSNTINLQDYFYDFLLFTAIIKKKDAPAGEYITSMIANFGIVNAPVNNCTDLQIKYQTMLADMNYCKDGCDVTFFLRLSTNYTQMFLLQTSGFTYVPPSLRG